MSHSAVSILLRLTKFAVPVGIVTWLLWRMEPDQWEQLRSQPKHYGLLVGALAVAQTALLISFTRWWMLVRCQGISLSIIEALRLGAIGYLLAFVSVGSVGGDLFKAIFLASRTPGKRVEAVASVFVDRGSGLLGLVLLVVLAMAILKPPSIANDPDVARIGQATALVTVVGFVVLGILVLGGKPIDRMIQAASTWRHVGKPIGKIAGPLRTFHEHPWAFAMAIAMSVVIHVLLSVAMYMIARGLYAQPPTLADHLLIVPITNVAAAMPIAPAGLGVTEAMMNWLYKIVPPVPTMASGVLVALVYEIVKVIMATVGVIFYWSAGRDVSRSLQETRDDEISGDVKT